jgi:hypothetical protein
MPPSGLVGLIWRRDSGWFLACRRRRAESREVVASWHTTSRGLSRKCRGVLLLVVRILLFVPPGGGRLPHCAVLRARAISMLELLGAHAGMRSGGG